MAYLQTEILGHTQKVCRLYKSALKHVFEYAPNRAAYRYAAVCVRQKFEENRHLTDALKVQTLIEDTKEELFQKQHSHPFRYATSPGGSAYGRELKSPDWVLDLWSPDEKAQYPEYFARREEMKKEYIVYWEKKFGNKAEELHHHH
ncbi:NADH dehydrogenase [ubiquinone] 1 beta subcomplex subunit 9-like [Daphnia pulex]|uniref:NADH dehydrogenase [ubiquinone] 1 beta subcomplex subunit 9-like n=1 Tax=Daphnia pulex TaxID=6669 RepID=UPI001EE00D59|nr:NADH dehydrogenase [ubiquinone] 1 beta subcomplex subunit 9-like [Daphnia pulex]XP_046650452.1 NADH dehydrogenase [ubiquinone] 1 beta subcomplex subunit 9-like [Daphnia pulicaria]